ncbi:ovostatin homolog isoform X2 [Meleagris gallopavo]|uniref:ovostatin homolog isoform X2 n=1 Tax=Meleagris gallopavo TaxID=9103 RepID=UPI00093B8357|nr:ovostatin homolog isoform X2 [Meleagris gallopavo]
MRAPALLLALTLFLVIDEASLELQYMVIFPAVIHHFQEEKLCIHFSSVTEDVHLAVTLEVETWSQTVVEKDVEKPGIFECISFKSEEVFFLHVLIHSSDNVLFEGYKKVLVMPQKSIILIQTDKAFYKPGETVKFRIVNLDDDLMVIKNEYLQIWLQDPENNHIAEWLNVKSRHGIVDLSFPLASEAALGKYTISVQQGMAQKTFSVNEYELTKFELKFEHPPFITEDEEFQLKLCGKYTYGKPAQGKIDITFITFLQYKMKDFSNSTEMRKQQSWTDKNGCAKFTIKTKALELDESVNSIVVIGEMEEIGTGARAKKFSPISIVTRMKSIEFINLQPFYKRGLPYTGQMFCHSNDSALQNEMVYLTIDVDDEKTYLSFLTDEEGKVHFSLNTTSWNSSLVSLKGTFYLENHTMDNFGQNSEIGESFYWLKPFYSESNSFLEIKARNDVMPCDQEQKVQVDYILNQNKLSSGTDHIDFYYIVSKEDI